MSKAPKYYQVPAGTPPAACKAGCAPVFWITTDKGAKVLVSCGYDGDCLLPTATEHGVGVSHFLDCPDAKRFSKSSRMRPGRSA